MLQISSETRCFILVHEADDVRTLVLQASKYPKVDMPTAITQIAGRQIASRKIPSWSRREDIRFPRHLSLEQCSSEITARYKASLTRGESFADLTGGFGIDCAFLSSGFQTATYVEQQEELCEFASHNFAVLGLSHITVKHGDGVGYLREMQPVDCLFLDPARRDGHGGKVVAIKDCEPDVSKLEELLLEKGRSVMVKLSPMLDLSQVLNELKHVEQIHIVSVNNECKELLLILARMATSLIPIHCVNLVNGGEEPFVFTREQEAESECNYTNQLGKYLFEPNASILKAGAFRILCSTYPILKLHPNSHLYTSDEAIAQFPGRMFRIVGCCGLNKKEIKEGLCDLKKANITIRNFPASVAELRKRLRLADGGDAYLFATTLYNGQKILIRCEKA